MANTNVTREIVLDTETTGLDPKLGDRIVEIGCVELVNFVATGKTFHVYLNPERDIPLEAFRIHGLSRAFLNDKPKFSDILEELLIFIAQSNLIIHNAEFDVKFLDAELARCGGAPLSKKRIVDTLAIARRKHPGASNSLDALCARYKIDNSKRAKHGALLDAKILADIYVELIGGRQTVFSLKDSAEKTKTAQSTSKSTRKRAKILQLAIQKNDLASHGDLLRDMGAQGAWNYYISGSQERSDGSA